MPRSRRKRKPKTAVKTKATAKYHGAALLGAKPGAEKPQMVRKKKIRIRKGSSVGEVRSRLGQDWVKIGSKWLKNTS